MNKFVNPNLAVHIANGTGTDLSKIKKSWKVFPSANQIYYGRDNVFKTPYSHSLWVGVVLLIPSMLDVLLGGLIVAFKTLLMALWQPFVFGFYLLRAGLRGTATGVSIDTEDFDRQTTETLMRSVISQAHARGLPVMVHNQATGETTEFPPEGSGTLH